MRRGLTSVIVAGMWGLDLGTTNSALAQWSADEGRPHILAVEGLSRSAEVGDPLEAPRMVPSAVQLLQPRGLLDRVARWPFFLKRAGFGRLASIGQAALDLNQGHRRPGFVNGFKADLARAPLRPLTRVGDRAYAARGLTRVFLRELLVAAGKQTGARIDELVITTPVEAFERYRAELIQIARDLGIGHLQFIDEPVAAALGYTLGLRTTQTALVVDFGGGTLDLALVSLEPSEAEQGRCRVLGKSGRAIGGNLVDEWLLETFCRQLDYKLPKDPEDVERRLMLREARRVKEALHFDDSATFWVTPPDEMRGARARIYGDSPHLEVEPEWLEARLTERGLYSALEACIDEALGERVEPPDTVLMVGGSTLLPGVYPLLERRFGRDRVRAWQPFEAVAYGAAAFAAGRFGAEDFIVHDYALLTHDPQTHAPQYQTVVPAGTRFPTAPDFWRRTLVPTCSRGTPETIFRLTVCELGHAGPERAFGWDAGGKLHKIADGSDRLVVELNGANPTLGRLDPPHPPEDRAPRLEVSLGVNAERWLCACVRDLKTGKALLKEEAVVRLL